MIRHTHIYELLYMIARLLVALFFIALVFDLGNTVFRNETSWLFLVMTIPISIGCGIGVGYLLDRFIGWLPAFLYIRFTLSTEVSPYEAKMLSFLFDGSLKNGKWYPLQEIRGLRPESRRKALFQFARKVASEQEK